MADYGHSLWFAANIIPAAHDPAAVVALARQADRAGLDLVTFQDHPYQPAFLDTWTLLGYVAAATDRIRLAGNVHPLPLRPPAVLAQAAASLDLLSGGRLELALGAGGFADAIAAMGGPRRSGAAAVEALAEAIGIIRASWDTATTEPIRLDGRHYRIDGLPPGPRPAHDVGIWVGGYKPRMLHLIGRQADGWIPSLPSLANLDTLARGNAGIDAAAVEAGRSPRDIRRLLNLGRPAPAELLAEIALGHGVSVFTVLLDDADQIRRLAAETAPAVRELVAAERSSGRRAAGGS